jgi:hypothetical protein
LRRCEATLRDRTLALRQAVAAETSRTSPPNSGEDFELRQYGGKLALHQCAMAPSGETVTVASNLPTGLFLVARPLRRTGPWFLPSLKVSPRRRMIDEKGRLLQLAIARSTDEAPAAVATLLALARSYEAEAARLSMWKGTLHSS